MKSTNSSRKQTRCRTLAEIDFINSSAFRQTQVRLQHRQEQLNRNQFERLLTHDKEHAELKQFLKQIRHVDSAKCKPADHDENDGTKNSDKVDIAKQETTRDDTVRNAKERCYSDSDMNLPDHMAGLNLHIGGGERKLPFNRERNNPDEEEAKKTGYFGVKDETKTTIKSAKVTLSKEEKIMKQIAALASNNTVSPTSPKNDVMFSASEANASSATVIAKPVRAGFTSVHVDSSSASDDESVFEDTETKRHRQRRKVIRRQSKSLDAQSPPRTTSTNGICRNCCVKQYQFSDERNLNVFIASQKSILKRRKSSSDIFRTKQLTPGQLVDLQTNRDRPSIFDNN